MTKREFKYHFDARVRIDYFMNLETMLMEKIKNVSIVRRSKKDKQFLKSIRNAVNIAMSKPLVLLHPLSLL